jgi:hypothetical protein
MLPAGNLVPDEGIGYIANRIADVSNLGQGGLEALLGDGPGAAEAIVHQMHEEDFQRAFAEAAAEYGQEHNLEWMSKWTFENVRNVFIGVASVNVIISATDFLANYVFNNRSAAAFNWAAPSGSVAPNATTTAVAPTSPTSVTSAPTALPTVAPVTGTSTGALKAGDRVTTLNPTGDSIRLRVTPSMTSVTFATVPNGSSALIREGPATAEGYTWYEIETSEGTGWTRSNFLKR